MEINDIITLAKAGFDASAIAKLAALPTVQSPAPAPAPALAPAPSPAPGAMAGTVTGAVTGDLLESMLNQMQQRANLAAAQQPQAESVDSILASIINPPMMEGIEKRGK